MSKYEFSLRQEVLLEKGADIPLCKGEKYPT